MQENVAETARSDHNQVMLWH